MNSPSADPSKLSQRLAKLFLGVLLFTTFGYLFYRFRRSPHVSTTGLVVYSFVCWVTVFGVIHRFLDPSGFKNGFLMAGILVTAWPLLFWFPSHLWDGLAVVKQDNEDQTSTYLVWERDGTSHEAVDIPLKEFHIDGDEGAHLSAINALVEERGNLKALKQRARQPQGHNQAYWINRSFRGHPLGFHLLYLPAAKSPPFGRIMASFFFVAAIFSAYWAGQRLDSKQQFGLFSCILFATIAHLFWYHGFRVSSDVLPCIPAFLATGCFWNSIHKQAQSLRWIQFCGILLAIACSITHTASLVVMGFIPLLWMHHRQSFWRFALWLVIPAFLITLLGISLSAYIVGPEHHGIIGRFFQETRHAKEFDNEGKDIIWMVRRLPRDLGIPMLLFVIWSATVTLKRMFTCRASRYGLLSALAILVPATTLFFAEIRYTYPGWLLVMAGFGGLRAWQSFTLEQRAVLSACLITFIVVKFLFLRIELAHA